MYATIDQNGCCDCKRRRVLRKLSEITLYGCSNITDAVMM